MKLDVRKTTPLTADENERVRAFADPDTVEHEGLAALSPVPLREGSEGSVLRALVLLGMAYVHERSRTEEALAAGYDELAADRKPAAGLRDNMTRRARGR